MKSRSTKMLAVLMVSLMAVVALAPLAGEETDAATSSGDLYGVGKNTDGKLGYGTSGQVVSTPVSLSNKTVSDVFMPYGVSMFVTTDNELYASGSNAGAVFSADTTTPQLTSVKIAEDASGIVKAVDTKDGIAYLNGNGEVYALGLNSKGWMGAGNTTSVSVPTKIAASLGAIKDIVSVTNGIILLTEAGSAYGAGYNSHGELGTGNKTQQTSFVQIGATLGTISAVYSDELSTVVLVTEDLKVYGMGSSTYGTLGNGSTSSDVTSPLQIGSSYTITSVECSGRVVVIHTSDNKTYMTGGYSYMYGLSGSTVQSSLTEITFPSGNIVNIIGIDNYGYRMLINVDGTFYARGSNDQYSLGINDATTRILTWTEPMPTLDNKEKIILGTNSSSIYAITSTGELYGMGANTDGILGSENTSPKNAPVRIGTSDLGVITDAYINGMRLYFIAKANSTVTISANNAEYGTVSPASVTAANGSEISTDGNVLTIGSETVTATPAAATSSMQYAFVSWSGIPAGGVLTEDTTITANFSASAIMTVTLDAGKGSVSTSSLTVVEGQPIGDLPTPTPKAGYTFTGWFDSEGNEVTSETIVTETESFTLYAQYELDDSLKPVKAMTDLLPLIFVVGIIILMIGTAFYYYRP